MSEITVSWDASPTPGVTYNVYRGQTPGNESSTPLVTGVTQDAPDSLTSVDATVNGLTTYHGTISDGSLTRSPQYLGATIRLVIINPSTD